MCYTSLAHIWATLPHKKVSKCGLVEILNFDMCLVDLVEKTLNFVEALLHRLTLAIRLPNLPF